MSAGLLLAIPAARSILLGAELSFMGSETLNTGRNYHWFDAQSLHASTWRLRREYRKRDAGDRFFAPHLV
ncbi:hypothetical protein Q6348_12780 [Isoptericola sp. b441]|uniref:Uncharacterized protein n=1 Tax=Actinotalea lenta TaxID=3064654 RepID=A0ABT9DEN2_9CELL|nr:MULTISPECIES: hypothetical protein [unclassified Isoptericola]MDO8108071.1 hypothetical protein [Isoptericola sp. b441]MDO8120260.1 hypothetical protein [Isoptericola sp. b490]